MFLVFTIIVRKKTDIFKRTTGAPVLGTTYIHNAKNKLNVFQEFFMCSKCD